ncbi:MAG: hypothetical protein HY675_24190 [Chloroflexi bacterium]|nr:hypothetical protein [Chloroflexota bacterium]
MPGIRIVSESAPPHTTIMGEIENGVSAAMDDIIAALTQPLTPEERSPRPKDAEEAPRIVFSGNLQEVNAFFYKRGWGDGWPIIPPTEEAVAEMLAGTDLPPDHVVAKIIPRYGKATVEKIAINAVVAGALPTYMPLLIAGVQAMVDPRTWFGTWQVSTGAWVPFWIVNGPVRNELHINGGSGALSPGDIANATIGRAMGLIIKNIGGARKGIEDMGAYGNPGKYTMVMAENEEVSPWEPFHVQQGFSRDDSTICLFFQNSFAQIHAYSTDHKGILNSLIYNVPPAKRDGLTLVMINPQLAKILAKNGWTKDGIARFMKEYARVPAYRHPNFWPVQSSARYMVRKRPPVNPEESMALINDPERVRILVAGGPGNWTALAIGGTMPTEWVTRKLELPANWAKLVEKYKALVPTYARY